MTVTDLKRYPVDEFNGWLAFYAEKQRRERVEKGDLMALDFESGEGIGQLKKLGLIK